MKNCLFFNEQVFDNIKPSTERGKGYENKIYDKRNGADSTWHGFGVRGDLGDQDPESDRRLFQFGRWIYHVVREHPESVLRVSGWRSGVCIGGCRGRLCVLFYLDSTDQRDRSVSDQRIVPAIRTEISVGILWLGFCGDGDRILLREVVLERERDHCAGRDPGKYRTERSGYRDRDGRLAFDQ